MMTTHQRVPREDGLLGPGLGRGVVADVAHRVPESEKERVCERECVCMCVCTTRRGCVGHQMALERCDFVCLVKH